MNASIDSAKDWLRQLLVWHTGQYQEIQRAALAKANGLDPQQYARPFPGSPQNTTIVVGGDPPPPTPPAPEKAAPSAAAPDAGKRGTPAWVTAVVAAGALATGLVGPVVVSALQRPAPAPAGRPAVVEPIRLKLAAWRLGADGEWEVQGPDGSWKKVKDLTSAEGK